MGLTLAASEMLTAKCAICVRAPSNEESALTVLYEKEADRPITPASIIKLLTAVTALRVADACRVSLSTALTVMDDDMVAGSGQNVRTGDRFSFRHSLANLLLASSNVTANVIARSFGSILLSREPSPTDDPLGRFMREMNAVAVQFQMTGSRFVNPHGLATKGQRSTARDLSHLVKECLNYAAITELWGLDSYAVHVDGPDARTLAVNSIFRESSRKTIPDFFIPQFIGGKSGTLWPSAFNLAAVSETPDGDLIISVTIGSPSLADRHSDYLALVELANTASSMGV